MSIDTLENKADAHGMRPQRTLRARDAFIVAAIVPCSAFGALGYSIVGLGGWGAATFWGISVLIACGLAVFYAEMSAMFPTKSGGIALYGHEAWRKYFSPIGALAGFGYWFSWSSSIGYIGVTVGYLVQAQWFSGQTWTLDTGLSKIGLPQFIAAALVVVMWAVNVLGVKPTIRFNYIFGSLFLIPCALLMVAPLTGSWSSSNLTWNLGQAGQAWGGWKLALVWLYLMGYSVWGIECVVTFAPEMRNPIRDVRRALIGIGIASFVVFTLMTIGAAGLATSADITANPVGFFATALNKEVGIGSGFLILCICASSLIGMNSCTADGARALYGMSLDRLTIKQLGVLNRRHVPARAMTLDLVLNVLLVVFVTTPLAILVAGNLGYFVAVFFAITGFILLRRDRPRAVRPIRVPSSLTPLAWGLSILVAVLALIGMTSSSLTGYGGTKETVIGLVILALSLVLFAFRRASQDHGSLDLHETGEYVQDRSGLDPVEVPTPYSD